MDRQPRDGLADDLANYEVPGNNPKNRRGRRNWNQQRRPSAEEELRQTVVEGGKIPGENEAWVQFEQNIVDSWHCFKNAFLLIWGPGGLKGILYDACTGVLRAFLYLLPVLLVIVAGYVSQFADDIYLPTGFEQLRKLLEQLSWFPWPTPAEVLNSSESGERDSNWERPDVGQGNDALENFGENIV